MWLAPYGMITAMQKQSEMPRGYENYCKLSLVETALGGLMKKITMKCLLGSCKHCFATIYNNFQKLQIKFLMLFLIFCNISHYQSFK